MQSNKTVVVTLVAASVVSISSGTVASLGDNKITRSLPLSYFSVLEDKSPGAVQNWLRDVEARTHGKISAESHDETGSVDLNCFDCDVLEFDAIIQLASPKNDFFKER